MESQELAAKAPGGNGGKRMSTGSIFYKTKLCSRFRTGNCPYSTNCNFAHGLEELRKPPPGWEEFVNPPVVQEGNAAKLRPCKKFLAEGICPYGERCIFSHEDPVAAAAANNSPALNAKPLNWKTRLCNKWETSGLCPFGEKCHFAHGIAELQKYGGEPQPDSKTPKSYPDNFEKSEPNLLASNQPQLQLQLQHQNQQPQQQQQIHQQKPPLSTALPGSKVWRGPTQVAISTIYGDWLEDEDEDEDDEDDSYEELGSAPSFH